MSRPALVTGAACAAAALLLSAPTTAVAQSAAPSSTGGSQQPESSSQTGSLDPDVLDTASTVLGPGSQATLSAVIGVPASLAGWVERLTTRGPLSSLARTLG